MITQDFQSVGPAYSRDYKSAADAKAAFLSGVDFIMLSMGHNGTYCSKRDFQSGLTVSVYYDNKRKQTQVKIP